MTDRRRLSKAGRQAVYDKTGGHCAYCGDEIRLNTMQADHVDPLRRGGEDDIGNMLPACRSCNHYKSSQTLEGFRTALERMPSVLMRDSVTYKNAVRFGLVTPMPHRVVFFYERIAALSERGGEDG